LALLILVVKRAGDMLAILTEHREAPREDPSGGSGAVKLGVFGTKMRSVINLASKDGIAAIVAQQFDVGAQIAKHGADADH
jgi:hypothetical protein